MKVKEGNRKPTLSVRRPLSLCVLWCGSIHGVHSQSLPAISYSSPAQWEKFRARFNARSVSSNDFRCIIVNMLCFSWLRRKDSKSEIHRASAPPFLSQRKQGSPRWKMKVESTKRRMEYIGRIVCPNRSPCSVAFNNSFV